jgi:hypothetical protein
MRFAGLADGLGMAQAVTDAAIACQQQSVGTE